ncbi:hypothetical protein EYC84_007828 [Monilinia fructicola]|uniref:Uncharacterized protein n=1 Tax=Monilinia fructicola TaxID=38448 RepID=A0A5M9JH28_MONFR|nr:hypothetical protein EYC84_007828 [Monilinia fructicola]
MSAAQIFIDQDRIKQHREARECLQPWNQNEKDLCFIARGQKSSVTILSGDSGTGKSTYIPAIVATKCCKTLLSHPNPLAIRTTYKWMESNRQGDMFANGSMAGKVELVTEYNPSKFGIDNMLNPKDLTLVSHSILSGLITNDQRDGLDTLGSYKAVFIDEDYFDVNKHHDIVLKSETNGTSKIPLQFAEAYLPKERKTELESIIDKIIGEKTEAEEVAGILIFLPSSEIDEVCNHFRYKISLGTSFVSVTKLTIDTVRELQDTILQMNNKIVFTTKETMIGVTIRNIDSIIISGEYEGYLFDPLVGQSVYQRLRMAWSDVEQQVSIIGNLAIKGSCYLLFTESQKETMERYSLSALAYGDCLEYILIIVGLFPTLLPVPSQMRLLTYPQQCLIPFQTRRLRVMGLIEMQGLETESGELTGYCLTEAGQRAVKAPMLNGLARCLFGMLEYNADSEEYVWYITMACILAYPDRPYVYRTPGTPYSKEPVLKWGPFVPSSGDIAFEQTYFNYIWDREKEKLSGILEKDSNNYFSANVGRGIALVNLRFDLRAHFKRSQEIYASSTESKLKKQFSNEEVHNNFMKVFQWNICELSKDASGNLIFKHLPSQIEMVGNQDQLIIDYNEELRKFPTNKWVIFCSISKNKPKYQISRLYNACELPSHILSLKMNYAEFERFVGWGIPL